MYDNICISYKNKNSNIRCNRKCKNNSLFCGYHKNKKSRLYIDLINHDFSIDNVSKLNKIKEKICSRKIYNFINANKINYLDNKYNDYLIGGELSWCEIDPKYRIYLNKKELWDIRFLVKHFATQLELCNSSLPSPQLPSNPFNRKIYSYHNIVKIYNKLLLLNDIDIPIQLRLFFENCDTIFDEIISKNQKLLNVSDDSSNQCIFNLVNYFNKYMRFRIINKTDSQDNYIGKWVCKNEEVSIFEHLYNEWNNLPPYIAQVGNTLIENPEKAFFKEILNSCTSE